MSEFFAIVNEEAGGGRCRKRVQGALEQLRAANLDSLLAPDATVVMKSCSTGKGREWLPNVANFLAGQLPGRRVFAPILPTNSQLRSANFVESTARTSLG